MSSLNRQRATADEIYTALTYIPSDDRTLWIKIGLAIHSELANDGFRLWDQWSQSSGSYNEKDAIAVWKSFKPGKTGIGTLFYYAKQYGYNSHGKPEKAPNIKPAPIPNGNTAAYALRLWLQADYRTVTSHPYAISKDIETSGGASRTIASGRVIGRDADCLIIPIRDILTENVVGVQCINSEGKKQSFGSVLGNGLLLGNTLDKTIPWYICEGWASAYSMVFHHQNGNGVCAASFGKSNQDKLAQKIADAHNPDEIIILREVD